MATGGNQHDVRSAARYATYHERSGTCHPNSQLMESTRAGWSAGSGVAEAVAGRERPYLHHLQPVTDHRPAPSDVQGRQAHTAPQTGQGGLRTRRCLPPISLLSTLGKALESIVAE